jgi:glutathione S-transferase
MHSGFRALRTQTADELPPQPDGYRWDSTAQADIDRIQQIWRDLRDEFAADGDFLCGGFSILDAMFAPVVMRFLGYGVALDDDARRYVETLTALPAVREWRAAADAEVERIEATDSLAA